jgi:hypothetical protein
MPIIHMQDGKRTMGSNQTSFGKTKVSVDISAITAKTRPNQASHLGA